MCLTDLRLASPTTHVPRALTLVRGWASHLTGSLFHNKMLNSSCNLLLSLPHYREVEKSLGRTIVSGGSSALGSSLSMMLILCLLMCGFTCKKHWVNAETGQVNGALRKTGNTRAHPRTCRCLSPRLSVTRHLCPLTPEDPAPSR